MFVYFKTAQMENIYSATLLNLSFYIINTKVTISSSFLFVYFKPGRHSDGQSSGLLSFSHSQEGEEANHGGGAAG